MEKLIYKLEWKLFCVDIVPINSNIVAEKCIIKPFIDKIIKLIPKELTYILIFITSLDFIITIITK